MKHFSRSLFGKITLSIVFFLCVSLGIISILMGIALAERSSYSMTAEEYVQAERRRIVSNQVQGLVYDYFWTQTIPPSEEDKILLIQDAEGEKVFQSKSYKESGIPENTEIYIYYLITEEDEEGSLYYADWVDQKYVPDPEQFQSEIAAQNQKIYMVQVNADLVLASAGVSVMVLRVMLWAYGLRYAVWPVCAAAWILAVIIFVVMMRAAGHKAGSEELVPGPFFRVPYDLVLVGYTAVLAIGFAILDEFPLSGVIRFGAVIVILAGDVLMTLVICISLASRLKQHVLWNRLLTVRLARFAFHILRKACAAIGHAVYKLPMVWRTAALVAVISALEFFGLGALHREIGVLIFFWILEKILLVPFVLHIALTMRTLQNAGRAMASGNLHYEVETRGMLPDFREHANNLSSISDAMSREVEQRLKSERMKTELITNVSHDIKTPLTSIINYTDLIIREKPENENIAAYCEVLTRQCGKLRRLIEDLVEASKASTGNLEVNPVPCSASVFLQQAGGEYEEKLQEAGLALVTRLPEQEVMILADSRRMWRVFDNLMNNICKYSQRGTRVYLSLETEQQEAVITFKNTSAQQLDISPEELMERFVRGDASRNTEGNGLGLAIARSLTELQGGSFDLQVDGDLFKAILRFPVFFMTS